jgi:hypothetical protein
MAARANLKLNGMGIFKFVVSGNIISESVQCRCVPVTVTVSDSSIWNLATPDIEGCFDNLNEAFDIEGCFDIEYTTFHIEVFASIHLEPWVM